MIAGLASIHARFRGNLGAFALDAEIYIPARGVTAIFGPSGCGKTSVLRCIAGLQRLPGYLAVGDAVWQDSEGRVFLPPYLRDIGYVFQEASLFAHLSVQDNLLFGAKRALKQGRSETVKFETVVDLLRLSPLLPRATSALSGGERQRVAIGRALLSQPALLLMDEPLVALEMQTKREILAYLAVLPENLQIPMIYVTHDSAEVKFLADRTVIMSDGRAVQVQKTDEIHFENIGLYTQTIDTLKS